MARIKIEDLPRDQKISDLDLKRIRGGLRGLQFTRFFTHAKIEKTFSTATIASSFVPGGSVVSSAISGFSQLKDSSEGSSGG